MQKQEKKKLIDKFQMKMQHLKTTHHNSIVEHNLSLLIGYEKIWNKSQFANISHNMCMHALKNYNQEIIQLFQFMKMKLEFHWIRIAICDSQDLIKYDGLNMAPQCKLATIEDFWIDHNITQ
jgi:hypothetical protein